MKELCLCAMFMPALAGCLDQPRAMRESRLAYASVSQCQDAVRHAAIEFGSHVELDEPEAHIITAAWQTTLNEADRKQFASDSNAWRVTHIVTLPLQLVGAMYGGTASPMWTPDAPETFRGELSAAIRPVNDGSSEISIVMSRPGTRQSRRQDLNEFWALVGREVSLEGGKESK